MKAVVFALMLVMLPGGVSALPRLLQEDPRIEYLAQYLDRIQGCRLERFTEIIAQTCAEQVCGDREDVRDARAHCEHGCRELILNELDCRGR